MFLLSGSAGSLLFMVIAIPCLYVISPFVVSRLWADDREVGISTPYQRSRCPREQLAAMRLEPTRTKYGPACCFVRKDVSVAFKAQVGLWDSSQLAALAGYLGLPLFNEANRRWHVCGFRQLNEPVSVNGVPSHEVCPCCGYAFDNPADLNDQAYRNWRDQTP